ncbi:MAG TPA: VCBS repeat-containing protein [Puia sp.]|nr:VCBS repeat-containing protein [Puia sp.]
MPKYSGYSLLVAMAALLSACHEDKLHLFTRLDEEKTGINFKNQLFESESFNVMNYIYFYNGGGVAIGDINNDGLPDILFTGNMVKNRLFLNKGNFQFEDITEKSGIASKQGWCTGATMVDINGDGKLDIYICRSADFNPNMRQNLLFINNGNLTFTEKAAEYGLGDRGYSTQAVFFDYDKDGDLDMFLINHSLHQYTTGAIENSALRDQRNSDFACKLFRNDPNDSLHHPFFTDVSQQAGIYSNVFTFGLGVVATDINNDGWPDLYVSNDFNEPDYLFINNKNGTFTNRFSDCMDQASLYSMGCDAADFNNDGNIDLVTLDMLPKDNRTQKMHSGAENFEKFQMLFSKGFYYQYSRNMLQKNNGDGTFSEMAQFAGVSNTDWSWSALFSDFDNDGKKDLFVSNGYVKDYTDMDYINYTVQQSLHDQPGQKTTIQEYIKQMPENLLLSYMFQNKDSLRFENRAADWGFDKPTVAAGAAYVDLDNDGDLDLVVNNTNDFASVFRNNSETLSKSNWIRIKLQGDARNLSGIGSKVKIYAQGDQFYQEAFPVRGYQSSVDPVLSFGLGNHKLIDSIIVIWPNDQTQKLTQVKTSQAITLNQKDAKDKWIYNKSAGRKPFFRELGAPAGMQHRSSDFNDFTLQKLLPNFLSKTGPAMATADINKDGREDIFFGGGRGEPSQIFTQNSNGSLSRSVQPAFISDSSFAAAGAAFFDADQDGDIDLYLASSGYELGEQDPLLEDRLFLNDGKGHFTKSTNPLPPLPFSKSCVKAADINGDGAEDLFIGGRVIPGKYPLSPGSRILLNDGKGKFTDATSSVAPMLKDLGMVTDAVWTDLNGDKKPDLVVVGEFMPVKVFINSGGKLTDESASYIPFESRGLWNTIYAGDMDGDGDQDLVLGNQGLNNQFSASVSEPLTLYYKDFDGNGSVDPILCYYIDGVSYPVFSRDDLTDQLPFLKKKFPKYADYSTATINTLFTPEQLQNADTLKAAELHSVYLENKNNKHFILHPLPAEVQLSPVYAITSLDFDGDGKKDLVLAGNNAWTRIRFGRYESNHGTVLRGDGKGNFQFLPYDQSGMTVRGDTRSLEVVGSNLFFGLNDQPARVFSFSK